MSEHVDTRDQRSTSLYPGRDRLSARIVYSSSGQTIPFDGFVGSDGLPSSISDRRDAGKKKIISRFRRAANGKKWISMSVLSRYPVSFCYLLTIGMTGAYFQGWLGWVIG